MKREERVHVALLPDGTPAFVRGPGLVAVMRGDLREVRGVGLVFHPDGKTVEMLVAQDGGPTYAPVVEARLLWDDAAVRSTEEGRGS